MRSGSPFSLQNLAGKYLLYDSKAIRFENMEPPPLQHGLHQPIIASRLSAEKSSSLILLKVTDMA